jgi:16S rRNA (adenine1518-N6/adenine1519-N6)-dimethyltransferase
MSFILKKKFGQNFLIDGNILNKIKNLIPSENLKILEIGPGSGKLTDKIISKYPSELTLVEIDEDLHRVLCEKYHDYKNIKIIKEDILKFNIKENYQLIISNLPYNISSQALVKITLLENRPEILILMFQKEFALRLIDKKLNSINSLVKCFYNIKLSFNVSKNCFRPIPKVDSSVLIFKKMKKKLLNKNEINDFIIFKRNLFSHKRKSLKNLLKKYNLKSKFDLSLRVEDLELVELIKIFRATSS